MKTNDDIPTTDTSEIKQLIDRVQQGKLDQGDAQLIAKLLGFLLTLIDLLQGNNTMMRRLKKLMFGLRKRNREKSQGPEKEGSEKNSSEPGAPANKGTAKESASIDTRETDVAPQPTRPNRPGHGRISASEYTGAEAVRLNHPDLVPGDNCPELGCAGHLHHLAQPKVKIYLTGQPLIKATKFERPVLRCSDCFTRYVAELPEGVKEEEKFDPTADVAIALYKYSGGLPFYRQARMQDSCGVPLPESVQFERCEEVAKVASPNPPVERQRRRSRCPNLIIVHSKEER